MAGKRTGVYAGSFDPPTNGHVWMIYQAAKMFDRLIVAVGINSDKKYMFNLDDRTRMLKSITRGMKNVEVTSFKDMFLVDFAKAEGADFIIRGIRDSKDFEYEKSIRSVNEDIEKGITTIFLMPPFRLSSVSSSLIKGLVGNRNWEKIVSKYVPSPVLAELKLHHTNIKGSSTFSENE